MATGLKLTCQQVSRLLSEGADASLPTADRARLRLHFVICEGCRNVEHQLGFLRRAMQRLGKDEPPTRR